MKHREIKFRAIEKEWKYKSTKKPEMVYGIESCYDDNIGDCFANFLSGDHHVMQYTGLKDKNGKEIYEGDIIENLDTDLRQIKYCNNSFEMRLLNGNRDSNNTVWWTVVEVIGNIYENPEPTK